MLDVCLMASEKHRRKHSQTANCPVTYHWQFNKPLYPVAQLHQGKCSKYFEGKSASTVVPS